MIRWLVKRVIDAIEDEGIRIRPILMGKGRVDFAHAAVLRARKRYDNPEGEVSA